MKIKKLASLVLATVLAVTAFTGCGDSSDDPGKANDNPGYIEGYLGDTMHTYFFDFTVNSAYTCASYENYTPAEGNQLLVTDLTVKNTFSESIEMYDTDFMILWDDPSDDAYSLPVTYNLQSGETLGKNMLPAVYSLAIKESRGGILVYEVPVGFKDFSIAYVTIFDNETDGDIFFVHFTSEQK